MALTPLDILQKQFGPSRKAGYEPEEVHRFLDAVRESWEANLKEMVRLRDELRDRDDELQGLRDEQGEIRETLVLARRMTLDLENTARREAELLIGEARLDAERILAAVHDERRTLQEAVVRLKSSRQQALADMRALVNAHGKMLDGYERGE
jgi:cell division initiation protein